MNGNAAAEVVRTTELRDVLAAWVAEHEADGALFPVGKRERNLWGGGAYRVGEGYGSRFTGAQYLRFQTGFNPRTIYRVMTLEHEYTSLEIADGLLTACGETHALEDGRVHVIPNPRWTLEHWHAYMAERGCV